MFQNTRGQLPRKPRTLQILCNLILFLLISLAFFYSPSCEVTDNFIFQLAFYSIYTLEIFQNIRGKLHLECCCTKDIPHPLPKKCNSNISGIFYSPICEAIDSITFLICIFPNIPLPRNVSEYKGKLQIESNQATYTSSCSICFLFQYL